MKVKKIAAALAAASIFSTLLLSGCQSDPLKSTAADKKIVMTVGDEKVELQEYRFYYLNNKRDLYGEGAELDAEQNAELEKRVAENIKNRCALLIMADKYKAKLTDDVQSLIDSEVESVRAQYASDEEYIAALKDQYLTHELYCDLSADSALAYLVVNRMKESGVIPSDDASVDKALASDDIVCIKEIYVYYPSAETRETALHRAEEALAKLNAGDSFESLMSEYSSYSAAELPPDVGYYTAKYDALDEVWDAASQLKIGEVSGIVESSYGFHIVKRCEKDSTYMTAHRDEIFDIYAQSKFYEEFYELYDTLTPEYTEYGSNLDITG